MPLPRRAVLLLPLSAAAASTTRAQPAFPSRPLKLIVPFAAGGAADTVARALAAALGEALGQTVNIDNRGGAGSITGTDAGARAAPDGHTLTLTNGAAITTGALLHNKLPYRPLEDFAHLQLLGHFSNLLVVRSDHPARSFADFIRLARHEPRGISWGSAGVGSAGFLAGELLAQRGGLKLVHVPYKGTGPALNDLLAGQIGALLTGPALALPHLKAGTLRALAISSAERSEQFVDVPTMNELVPGVVADAWFGIAVPARTPAPVLERLRSALHRAVQGEPMRAAMAEAGMAGGGLAGAAFERFLHDETAKWAPVIRAARITSD